MGNNFNKKENNISTLNLKRKNLLLNFLFLIKF